MNELSRKILDEYQVRKTRKQKTRFIEMMQREIPGLKVEQGGLMRSRNLIVGDIEKARVVFTAHYDTCARLPFPNLIFPKNLLLSLLYGVLVAIPFLLIGWAAGALLAWTGLSGDAVSLAALAVVFVVLFGVMLFGPANRHTANDNTSGVITLCELIRSNPENAAFVFFDNEEYGMIGSSMFRRKHRKAMKNRMLVNFDCVSDGQHMLLVLNRRAMKRYGIAVDASFEERCGKRVHIEKASSALYPSDQQGFHVNMAVAAMNKHKLFGLYLNKIHTDRDRVMDETNIEFLREGATRLVRAVINEEEGAK